jgi:hypothetical protein
MDRILEPLERTFAFLKRNPNLDGSTLLKKEAITLVKALNKYNEKAEAVELSLTADYAEAAALLEGDGKSLVTAEFIRQFTSRHCTNTLSFNKANKKERTALLLLAARDKKLTILKKQIDPSKKYREMYQKLLSETEKVIEKQVVAMKAGDFRGIVNAAGLDAPRTRGGAVSTAKAARNKVLQQIIRSKQSDELMDNLAYD